MSMTNSRSVFFSVQTLLAVLLVVIFAATAVAQERGEFTEEGVREFTQQQFEAMYRKAMANASERLEDGEAIKAFAVVADRKSEIRVVRIDKVETFPPNVALEVMRRSLRVLVKNGGIGATCLVYVAPNPDKDSNAEFVVVAEMEHIFGPTLAQVTPYSLDNGKIKVGKPVAVESKPSIFVFKKQEPRTTRQDS
ncbi:MAG: hypothetical protein R3280_00795 [Marinobacter sp.]|uniref:hypothetical protein n=1 Tax=Marinobacter sp. TaxID=50741 RepID=UPI00299E8D65|nr:hypothetical protein [Marinobacter sp.]MDX1633149.1 hypothetical protein [Marinobacter sp.]